AEDDEKYGKWEQHGWELPDELGQLNLPPGGFGWYGGYRQNVRHRYSGGVMYDADAVAEMSVGGMGGARPPAMAMPSAPPPGMAMPSAAPMMAQRKLSRP